MKRFIRIIIAVGALIVLNSSCNKDENNIMLSNSKLTFDYNDDEATVYVNCAGEDVISWNASANAECISFDPASGSCSKNHPDDFKIIINRQNIHQDSVTAKVTVNSSDGETREISLLICSYPESKIRFNFNVYDIDYDALHNQLLIAGYKNSDYFLKFLDLNNNNFTTILNNETINNVSVAPDCNFAIAQSSYTVTKIDLAQRIFSNSISTSYNDSYLAGKNNMAYSMDDYYLKIMDMNSGTVQSHYLSGYLYPDNIFIHPSGDFIYGSDGSTIFKIDIKTATPVLNYTSSNYNFNNYLSPSGDGTKLLTGNKVIYTINPDLTGCDITGTNSFQMAYGYVYLAAYNQVKHEYYFVPSNSSYHSSDQNSNQILVYDENLVYRETIKLEKFFISDYYSGYTLQDAIAKYIFVSSDGTRVIVVTQPYQYGSGYTGVEIFNR